jgi:hypothetical protein
MTTPNEQRARELLAALIAKQAKRAGGIRALSRKTGLGAGYLSRLSRGEKSNPTDECLSRLGIQRITTYKAKP